jgi:hypothetical protein
MTLDEILEVVAGEMIVAPPFPVDVEHACSSDLMSDVLMFVKPSMLLVTGLTNPQAVRTADMAEAPAFCSCAANIHGEYHRPGQRNGDRVMYRLHHV